MDGLIMDKVFMDITLPELLKCWWDLVIMVVFVVSIIFLIVAHCKRKQTGKKLLSFSLISSVLMFFYTIFGWYNIHEDDPCQKLYNCKDSICPALYSEGAPCLYVIDILVAIFALVVFIIMVAGIIKTFKKTRY